MDTYDHVDEYINSRVTDKDTRLLISDFAILWNQYEKALYDGEHHIGRIKSMIENHYEITQIENLDDLYNRFLKYLESRNTPFNYNGIINAYNIRIKSELGDKGDLLAKDLENAIYVKTSFSKIHLLLIIAAKVRNNMFHGTKDTSKLDKQKELFKICNELLMSILEITNLK